jgi:hypothetical protein
MIISVHIRKCAGTTFKASLKDFYKKRLLFDYGDEVGSNWPSSIEKRKVRLANAKASKSSIEKNFDIIHGHFFRNKYDFLGCRLVFATFLRDPVSRVLSNYFYLKRNPDRANPDALLVHKFDFSLEEFASHPDNQNLQSHYLQTDGLQELSFVGVVEEYEQSIKRFNEVFDCELVAGQNLNVNDDASRQYEVPQKTIDVIVENNLKDIQLYKKARNDLLGNRLSWV